jgi:prepilin-type processing-associated H-X9-DG protein
MPSINGVDFNNIVSINGVAWNSVTDISGVEVTHGLACTSTRLGYSDGRRNPPSYSCLATPQFYDFDATNELLYISGGCGITFAIAGYYSDGANIFFWDGSSAWSYFGACGR